MFRKFLVDGESAQAIANILQKSAHGKCKRTLRMIAAAFYSGPVFITFADEASIDAYQAARVEEDGI